MMVPDPLDLLVVPLYAVIFAYALGSKSSTIVSAVKSSIFTVDPESTIVYTCLSTIMDEL